MSTESELIKQRLKLSDYVGRYVALKPKSNSEYWGLCPFHQEKSPSFTVSDIKGFYHCFGCDAHGDIFSFCMQAEKLEYIDALKKLAQEAGVELPSFQKYQKEEKLKAVYQNIYKELAGFYHQTLHSARGIRVLDYLKKRGLSDATIKHFKLGYSPDYNSAVQHLLGKFAEKDLLTSMALRKKMTLYDVFAGRIIFPINDRFGHTIGFGGRILQQEENSPKYLNSSDSPLFHKGDTLYNLDTAASYISKKGHAIVVEGYMDVISLYEHGIVNAVAPLGTSLKVNQLEILWQFCDTIVCCLDGDAAGVRSMHKIAMAILPTLKANQYLKFCILPQSQDPDDYIKNNGVQSLEQHLKNAKSLADFLFDAECVNFDIVSPEGRAALQQKLRSISDTIENRLLSKEFFVYLNNKYWNTIKQQKNNKHSVHVLPAVRPVSSSNQELIALLIGQPSLLYQDAKMEMIAEISIQDKSLDKIRDYLLSLSSLRDGLDSAQVVRELSVDSLDVSVLMERIVEFREANIEVEKLFAMVLAKIQLDEINNDITILKEKLQRDSNESDFAKLSHFIKLRNSIKKNII